MNRPDDSRRILVIGNADSVWVKNYIKYILCGAKCKTVLFDSGESIGTWGAEYHNMDVAVLRFPDKLSKLRKKADKTIAEKLWNAYWCALYFKKLCKGFDDINMQYVEPSYFCQMALVRGIRKKLVLSFWGSDLLRRTTAEINMLQRMLSIIGCRYITFDNGDLKTVFQNRFRRPKANGEVLMLPLPILDAIDRIRACEYKNININRDINIDGIRLPADKVIVAIGYNGGEAQQHMQAIAALGKLSQIYKHQITVVLQMTYGGDGRYILQCERECQDAGLECVALKNYLSEEEVAWLRVRADVYINAQVTDAFSGSFCEYLYAGAVVMNARWLHYQEIGQYAISCMEFGSFDELPGLMQQYLTKPEEYMANVENNRKVVRRLRSVNACRARWRRLYKI